MKLQVHPSILIARLGTLLLFTLLSGCAFLGPARSYPVGQFNGRVTIEWIGADKFIYRPDPERPLVFLRRNGQAIKPGLMYTDGGSIPRPLWALRGYSPWGYGPAFIVHDWLFQAKHCGYADANGQSLDSAADIMGECMQTLVANGAEVPKDALYIETMTAAVRTSIARESWDHGECKTPPAILTLTPGPRLFSTSPLGLKFRLGSAGWKQTFDFDAQRKKQP